MAGIGIEVGLQELGSKFGYRNRDRSWVTGIWIEVGLQESGLKLGYRNLDRSWVTGIEIEVCDRNRD